MSTLDLVDNKIKNTRAIFYKIEHGNRLFLLTQESEGNYTFPGGCKDLTDVDLLAAMKRELWEELHVGEGDYEIKETSIHGEYENLYGEFLPERYQKNTIIYVFIVKCIKDKSIKAGDGIKSTGWFSEDECYALLDTPHMNELFRLGVQAIHELNTTV